MSSSPMPVDFVAQLEERNLLHQLTAEDLREVARRERITGYVGFDPTASSLHVGSLLPVLTLARLQRAGHRPIALVGGATGLIGDPSGKHSERGMLDPDEVAANVAGLRQQLERFLDFGGEGGALLVDNTEWLRPMGLLDFLREVGKHFTVNQLVVRDTVRPRLEDPDKSISFTEFSYVLLQAYDFLALFDRHDCRLQLGGSDQWGNIVSGCDLIRRKRGAVTWGLTTPLLTRPDGSKFGKTEQGNVWLDAGRTSVYEFYQFWLNRSDAEVVRCLEHFTFRPVSEIEALAAEVSAHPERRQAQRILAADVTDLVHGAEARQRAEHTTEILFGGGDWRELDAEALAEAFGQSPRTVLSRASLGTAAAGLVAVLADTGLLPSRSQARKAITSGAVYVNNLRVNDAEAVLDSDDLLAGRFIVLRRGKKSYHVLDVR